MAGHAVPSAFCTPVLRVVGVDADRLAASMNQHPGPVLTGAQLGLVATLRTDVRRALPTAPTPQLRRELDHYLFELDGTLTNLTVSDAFSRFDAEASTQLRACGVRPAGD